MRLGQIKERNPKSVMKARTEYLEKENNNVHCTQKTELKRDLTKAMLLQALLSTTLKNNTYATKLTGIFSVTTLSEKCLTDPSRY